MTTAEPLLLIGIVVLPVLVAFARSVRVVGEYQKGLVTRLSRYERTVEPGMVFLTPVIEDLILVDMRERIARIDPQPAPTRGGGVAELRADMYFRIVDPIKATYGVSDLGAALVQLGATELRRLIAERPVEDDGPTRGLDTPLLGALQRRTGDWGVDLVRVEVILDRLQPASR